MPLHRAKPTPKQLAPIALALFAGACGQPDDGHHGPGGGGPEGGGNSQDALRLSLVGPEGASLGEGESEFRATHIAPCDVMTPSMGPARGLCITPHNVRGWASQIDLGSGSPSNCGPGRLIQLGVFSGDGGPGRTGLAFDLAAPDPQGGESNLECPDFAGLTWSSLSIKMAYHDVQFELGGETWNVRFVFEANPINLEPEIGAPTCDLRDSLIASYEYLPSGVQVHRGDVLLCRKADPDESCADDEYQWVDQPTGELTSTRPEAPIQMAYMGLYVEGKDASGNYQDIWCNTDCQMSDPYCGFQSGGYWIAFAIAPEDQFKLHAEFITDQDPRHPGHDGAAIDQGTGGETGGTGSSGGDEPSPMGPVKWYRFEPVAGQAAEGYDLQLQLELQLDNYLFLEGLTELSDLDAASPADVLSALRISEMFRQGDPHNFGHMTAQTARVAVSVGQTP